MRSMQGFPFHSGALGVEGVFAWRCIYGRNCSQTVRGRSREPRMAVPMASSAKVVSFGGFQCCVASFRVACRRGTSWQSSMFHNVLTFVWQAHYFRIVSRRWVAFVVAGAALCTLDVSCCVFFANRIVRAAWSGDNVQFLRQAWHFLRCDEKWRTPCTEHWFWGSKFWGS